MKIKTLILSSMCLLGLGVMAQKSNVESAAIYLRNGEIEDAKKTIDLAIVHPETKADPKAWFYYVSILDTIYRNPAYENLMDANLADNFYNGCIKCIETDVKKRYEYYCKDQAILNSAFMCFNKGISAYEQKDYKSAIKFYEIVLSIIPYDKNEDLKKNKLSEKNLYLYMALSAMQSSDNVKSKIYLKKLMDLKYDDPVIYMQMANIYLEEKDTTSAIQFIEQGRTNYPNQKDLINQELNIYMSMGKQDVLLEKLNAAIEINSDDATLLFVRGSVYDNYANDLNKKRRILKEQINNAKKKAQTEKVPAKKLVFVNNAASLQKEYDGLGLRANEYAIKAEEDYKKVVEFNPEYIDAFYNLGALTNNKTTIIVEKMNAIPSSLQGAAYDKIYNPLKKQKDEILTVALNYFNQALALAEQKGEDTPEKKKEKFGYMRDILYSIQQVYANLGDEKKTMDTKKRRESFE
jgi:tetratricopeptide (TPR) repeat protein